MSVPQNENPGASSQDATGAEVEIFPNPDYRLRRERATTLCLAIADCDPGDACVLMEAAYDQLRAGAPLPTLIGVVAEADWWSEWATPVERKAYALACYRRMSPPDRVRFLNYVQGAA